MIYFLKKIMKSVSLDGLFCMLFILLYSSVAFGQSNNNKSISGTVTDSQSGETLPAVNIILKGTTTGTITDQHGNYKISVPSLQDSLIFTFIGYSKKVVPINGRTHIDIALKSKIVTGKQMVVTAYGVRKANEDVVGAVTSLNQHQLKTIQTAPTANLTTSLAGRIPGLIAFQRNGAPGSNNANFFVRGVTSFGFSKNPLILIDNIKSTVTDLANLNPDDIASFSILKDATATSLYGSEAANGVLVITTKTGHQHPLHVDLRMSNSISQPTEVPEFADGVTYMKMADQASLSRNPLQPLPYSQQKILKTESGANPYLYPDISWRDKLFKNFTMNQKVNLHVSGGGEIAQYFVSGSFAKTNGLLKVPKLTNFNNNIDLKNYSLRSNINVNLTKTTELAMKINGLFNNYKGPLNSGKEVYNQVVNANPVRFPAKFPVDSAHAFARHPLFGSSLVGGLNPYAEMVKGYKHYSTATINAQFSIDQNLSQIVQGLEASALFNVQRYAHTSNTRQYNPFFYEANPIQPGSNEYVLTLLNPEDGTNYLSYSPGSKTVTSRMYFKAQAHYVHTFGKKNGLEGLFVFDLRNQTFDNVSGLQASLPKRNVDMAGRLTYNYSHIYYAEFDFGRNASERFAKNHRWGFFPSVGVAWNISNEKFWKPIHSVVTNLKVRATFGFSGNDAISDNNGRFSYLSNVNLDDGDYSFQTGSSSSFSLNGVSISHYPNLRVTWEKAKKINFGIHLGLFNNFNAKANLYFQDRTQILQKRNSIPASMGLSATPSANTGEVKSRGFSTHVNYNANLGKNWVLQFRGNFTFAENEYVKFNELFHPNSPNVNHIGQPVGQQFGFYAERLFVDEQDVKNSPKQSFGPYGPGDIKFLDVNGDGTITNLDKVPLGYPTTPQIEYGFGFSGAYKDIDLSVFFQGLARESFWINTSSSSSVGNQGTAPFVGGHQLLKVFAKDHWSVNNQNLRARYPHFTAANSEIGVENNAQRSSWFMRNGAFMRLKEIQIGYSLPIKIVDKLSLRQFRIYLVGRNLAHFSKFKLWDPEMAGNGLGYPLQRVYSIGIDIKF